jgi:cold shock CspA family protein
MKTTVKWFNVSKGYGFLENGSGPDIYVNVKSLRGVDRLNTGDVVDFECHVFEGKLVARHVKPAHAELNGNSLSQVDGNSFGHERHHNGKGRHYSQRPQPRYIMQ